MITKASVLSNGETWVFEVGKTATFTDRAGKVHRSDFAVTGIELTPRLTVRTDLRGVSRYDWERTIEWAGDFEVLEESDKGPDLAEPARKLDNE